MPFEVNTTPRCVVIFFYEVIVTTFTLNLYGVVITLLFGLMVYSDACLQDIKLQFDHVDRLVNCKNSESEMLVHCKQAADLHGRLIR